MDYMAWMERFATLDYGRHSWGARDVIRYVRTSVMHSLGSGVRVSVQTDSWSANGRGATLDAACTAALAAIDAWKAKQQKAASA